MCLLAVSLAALLAVIFLSVIPVWVRAALHNTSERYKCTAEKYRVSLQGCCSTLMHACTVPVNDSLGYQLVGQTITYAEGMTSLLLSGAVMALYRRAVGQHRVPGAGRGVAGHRMRWRLPMHFSQCGLLPVPPHQLKRAVGMHPLQVGWSRAAALMPASTTPKPFL